MISLHVDKFFNRQSLHLNESEIQHEILAVAEGIVRFVEAALAPAKLLRERLITELRERANAEKPRNRQTLKRKRNQRIRELKKEHPHLSPSKLAEIASKDPMIREFGEKVTKYIVRDLFRGKTGRRPAG